MEIRRLTEADAQALWELRTSALQSEPEAFAESLEEHLRKPVESIAGRLGSGGNDNFVLGAISDSALVGMVGFYREPLAKRSHVGRIWGMYLAPEWRGRDIGRRLLEEAVRRAGNIPGLQRILLSVSSTQRTARHIYATFGFSVFGAEPQALQVEGRFVDQDHMGFTLRRIGDRGS